MVSGISIAAIMFFYSVGIEVVPKHYYQTVVIDIINEFFC
jgi:hypothetical protein